MCWAIKSLVAFHKLGIVFGYSNNDITNPKINTCNNHQSAATDPSFVMLFFLEPDPHTIFLVVVLHVQERVNVNVTRVVDIRLNAPKVIVLPHGFMVDEKSRLVPMGDRCLKNSTSALACSHKRICVTWLTCTCAGSFRSRHTAPYPSTSLSLPGLLSLPRSTLDSSSAPLESVQTSSPL